MDKPAFGKFCWTELATPNREAAKKFYGELLGWKFTDQQFGDSTYSMIENNAQEFAGMWEIPHDMQKEVPPHWMSYINVENLENTIAHAVSLGATVKMPITAAGDYGRFAIMIDPTGAHIAFWQANAAAC